MLAIGTTVETDTIAERLLRLAELYQTGQASPLMAITIDKLFAHETAESRVQLKEFQEDLLTFEAQYQMSSEEFYRRYQAGQMDDRMDFVEWASLVQMTANLQERLHLLTNKLIYDHKCKLKDRYCHSER